MVLFKTAKVARAYENALWGIGMDPRAITANANAMICGSIIDWWQHVSRIGRIPEDPNDLIATANNAARFTAYCALGFSELPNRISSNETEKLREAIQLWVNEGPDANLECRILLALAEDQLIAPEVIEFANVYAMICGNEDGIL